MKKLLFSVILGILFFTSPIMAQENFETDVINTSEGDLKITFIGHGSLLFNFKNKNIYIDPYSKLTDYSALPKADIIFITHHHRDHLDQVALAAIRTEKTDLVYTQLCAEQVQGGSIMKNGETLRIQGIGVKAVPAYNLIHKRDNGQLFHPKAEGNGYMLSFGDTQVYIAGDTENIPEMRELKNIDYAFLPMNLPYTMTPEMVADAAKSFSPKVLYPYHYGDTDPSKITELLKGMDKIKVQIREMQ